MPSTKKWIVQTINYANAAGVDWRALTNGAEWRIYKVHAQVEADRKLFTAVPIDTPEALDDAVRVLSLLSRDNMRARAIDELWQAWHVDRQVQAALDQTLQDDAFATLIRKRVPQLSLADIRKSLRRATISVSYPNIFREILASTIGPDTSAAAPPPPPAPLPGPPPETLGPSNVAGTVDRSSLRSRLQSTQDLLELGRLKVGDTVSIRGRDNSSARVLDGKHVDFKGQRMTFNEWGRGVTGWPSIRIYTMACLPDGRTLDELRDTPAPVRPRRPKAKIAVGSGR